MRGVLTDWLPAAAAALHPHTMLPLPPPPSPLPSRVQGSKKRLRRYVYVGTVHHSVERRKTLLLKKTFEEKAGDAPEADALEGTTEVCVFTPLKKAACLLVCAD
jgi:hypothetical protein